MFQVVDETDRLLREAYQSWLPTVLQLTRPSDESLFPCGKTILPSTFGSLSTMRRWLVLSSFIPFYKFLLTKSILSGGLLPACFEVSDNPGSCIALDDLKKPEFKMFLFTSLINILFWICLISVTKCIRLLPD